MKDLTVTKLQSVIGELTLRWNGSTLEALELPPTPPVEIPELPVRRRGDDWCDILNMKGITHECGGYTPFQKRVWRSLRKIPFGETRSYGWVAREIDNPGASRAVGAALGANPWPLLIPCHRVIRTDGRMGGFSSGLEWKCYLLRLEKEVISVNN